MILNDRQSNCLNYPSFLNHSRPKSQQAKKAPITRYIFYHSLSVICGADHWVGIEAFGEAKEDWFIELLDLKHGIPSHDTFGDVFAVIDTEEFSECFSKWVSDLATLTEGEVIGI